jgi:hypothetical protein
MADGILVVLPPLVELTKSGPQTASNSTANHMAAMANDAHISGSCQDHPCFARSTADGSCEIVDISHLLHVVTLADAIVQRIREAPDRDGGNPRMASLLIVELTAFG